MSQLLPEMYIPISSVFIDEHYKQMQKRVKPIEEIAWSRQKNPNYWLKTFMSKSNILQQGKYRNWEI